MNVLPVGIALCLVSVHAFAAGNSSLYTGLTDLNQNLAFRPKLPAAPASSFKLAKVHFVVDTADKIGFDDIEQSFDHNNAQRCKDLGFAKTAACAANQFKARLCPYDDAYYDRCCDNDYKYTKGECSYPNTISSTSCGGKYKCAAVACAALLVAGTIAAGHQTVQKEPGAVSISKNPFVICAQAAELTKDKPVYIRESVSNTFGYAAWDDGKTGKMGFVMEMPLSVKGDDIKTISYHMENGFFQVTDTGETDDMIVDSEAYEGDTAEAGITERGETEATLDIYQKHADDYMVKEVPSGAKEQALSSYTVAYDRQSSENTTINICGTQELSQDEITAMHSSTTDPGELAKLYDKVFKDTVITCTVTFNDGTSQKRQIGIGGAVMTYEELGTQTDEPVESPEDPSQKQAFLKLQIK